MIDGLLNKQYEWLIAFLLVEIFANVFMYKRMIYDTKVYTKIYNDLIFEYLEKDYRSEPSTKIARTEMTNNIIHFLEDHVQYYIMSIMSMIGTLFFIIYNDVLTGLIVFLCVVPISFIVSYFYSKIKQSTRVGNNQYEKKISMLNENNKLNIETYFKRRKKLIIISSTLQGKNWFSLNSTKTIFLVLAICTFTMHNSSITQGEAVAIYSYINQFLTSLMSIPIGVEMFARVRDIVKRISFSN
jgi:ABC-type multidrug transport system fused ATPase/permease subunit